MTRQLSPLPESRRHRPAIVAMAGAGEQLKTVHRLYKECIKVKVATQPLIKVCNERAKPLWGEEKKEL